LERRESNFMPSAVAEVAEVTVVAAALVAVPAVSLGSAVVCPVAFAVMSAVVVAISVNQPADHANPRQQFADQKLVAGKKYQCPNLPLLPFPVEAVEAAEAVVESEAESACSTTPPAYLSASTHSCSS